LHGAAGGAARPAIYFRASLSDLAHCPVLVCRSSMLIRAALPHDLVITAIYDHAVRHGTHPSSSNRRTRRK
jgi:hypothetical protein